ncbi:50S ribosomal protein L37e [Candidatus Woesearchaeota archaeon]|nr:50S ribosomal protein L37e [Candidatus Woesearchaeota archaeon]
MKGTYSMGRRNKGGTHIICRRCGRHSYHARKKACASCGFGKTTHMRHYNWKNPA